MKQSNEAIAEERPTEQEGDATPEQTCSTSDDEEWPVSWVVKRLEAEMHSFAEDMKELEARIEKLTSDQDAGISFEQFFKALALIGYRLIICKKDEDDTLKRIEKLEQGMEELRELIDKLEKSRFDVFAVVKLAHWESNMHGS